LKNWQKRVFTIENVLSTTNIQKEVLWVILSRLEKKRWIERIEKGKYTLNEFIIGSLLVTPYCVAYWSALNFYGLTEQFPNTVFLQTARVQEQVRRNA
jgi:predicted transcriptional regulator of viral defense system